jgi:hypothetical protein
MRKLTCHCEQTFSVDIPETVNLDDRPEIVGQIADGSFLACVCPTCGAELHTDLRTRFEWPSRRAVIVLVPELERIAYLSGTSPVEADAQVVIGYPELADRIAVLAAGLAPTITESIKYHLLLKAGETAPRDSISIFFEKKRPDGELEFHVHGLKKDEVAITLIPASLYAKLEGDFKRSPESEPYSLLSNGNYLSVKNLLIEDSQNA